MMELKPCDCNRSPIVDVEMWSMYPKTYYIRCICGKTTKAHFTAEQAITEWNEMVHGREVPNE